MTRLKKAENMIEAYQVFETQTPLTRQHQEFYVELCQNDIVNLRKELVLNSVPNKSFFVTGQAGNGKSTALVIVDDLEKMRDQAQAHELFIDNSYAFEAIRTTKIVTRVSETSR